MTPNKEDFIKAIFELGGSHSIIPNKELVSKLSVSAASVTDMSTRLLKEGIITREPYRGITLTYKGVQIANHLIYKHRIWEVFLAEKLGYQWNEVHDDADLLEHVSSDSLVERLDAFLDYPKTDPHGEIIPRDNSQEGICQVYQSLSTFDSDSLVTVKQVDDDEGLLGYLIEKGIQLEKKYKIAHIEPFEGPFTLIDENGQNILISFKAANQIRVI